ncbi:MAG: Gfo/Idh/MocA family oxidoreductase [Caldilineaceae bacterium]|jgi:predicted dehydrogenase|nr:Gfo/Idh/MocA family oxidoreductase [Caldilineaceae bacterium]
MTKLRVAVIGAGGIGGAHLRAYAAWPDLCELVGVADIDLALAQTKAAPYAIPAFADYQTMLDECRPDAVSICTPPRLHLPIAQEVARRGIACLCEKPPARTLAETQAIVAAFTDAGVVLQFAFCHRFHEPVRQVQELIAAGKLGKLIQVYNRFGFRFDRAASSWFTDAEVAGGGVLIDTLVHSIDIFRALAGEIVHVDAAVSTTLPVQVEDSASLQVVSATGVIGSLNCSWVTPVSEAEIRVWGTEGEAIIDYATNTGARYHLAGDHDWTVLPFELPDRFVLQAEHFLHCAHGNQPPRVSGADGIAVMHVIEAAYRSAQGNQTLVRP